MNLAGIERLEVRNSIDRTRALRNVIKGKGLPAVPFYEAVLLRAPRRRISRAAACQIQNQADDGQWLMPAKNFACTRFSTLTDINITNDKNLKLAWTFSTALTKGHEAAPLIVSNTTAYS